MCAWCNVFVICVFLCACACTFVCLVICVCLSVCVCVCVCVYVCVCVCVLSQGYSLKPYSGQPISYLHSHFNNLQLQLALLFCRHHPAAELLNVVVEGGVLDPPGGQLLLWLLPGYAAAAVTAAGTTCRGTILLHCVRAAQVPVVAQVRCKVAGGVQGRPG